MSVWVIVGIVALIIVLSVLFWFGDRLAKGSKSAVKKNKRSSKKNNDSETTPEVIHAIYEDKDFDNSRPHECHLTEKERDLAEQPKETVAEGVEPPTNQAAGKADTINTSTRISNSRIREYYQNRWGTRFQAHSQIYSSDKEDQGNLQISQEDVKKLLVLKDLFDKKG